MTTAFTGISSSGFTDRIGIEARWLSRSLVIVEDLSVWNRRHETRYLPNDRPRASYLSTGVRKYFRFSDPVSPKATVETWTGARTKSMTSWTRVHIAELFASARRTNVGPRIKMISCHRTLHDALGHQRDPVSGPNMDRDHRFSWSRCVISLISYALLLSDVLRSGLGMRNVASQRLKPLEPDTLLYIGPIPYSATHLTQTNATTTASASFWLYKYDTTSITMRAFAQHLRLPTWSPCTLYHQRCDESTGLSLHTIFNMIDSLVSKLASQARDRTASRDHIASATPPSPSLKHVMLRTESQFRDRLHHYALPWFFERTAKFTHQAIYYPYHNDTHAVAICGTARQSRPYSCGESWTKWRAGTTVISVWRDMRIRLAMLADLYPNHAIDFVVLDGAQDFTRGGVTYQGKKSVDVVVLTRVQACTGFRNCTTVAVDDYRYEAGAMVVNLDSWHGVVAFLRLVGQAYTWLRGLLLISVCTIARRQQLGFRSPLKELTATMRTVFLIPSQVVVYGSSFPIALYVVAHLTDSPAVYEIVSTLFNTLLGRFSWSTPDFMRHCAVSMRTVWILSLLGHFGVVAITRCGWSPPQGIAGVPEFLISFTAAFTIFAQYRSISLRDVRVLQVHEAVPSSRIHQLRGHTHDSTRSILSNFFFGSTIDAQWLITTAMALCGFASLLWLLNRISPKWFPYRITLCSRTLVPYSAGSLWPQSRLVVSWFGSIFERDAPATETFDRVASHAPNISMITFPSLGTNNNRLPRALRSSPEKGLVMRTTTASRQIQREMQSLDKRSREIESMVYLVNLAVMTDPISFLQLRIFSGCRVAVYESKLTQRCFLLPHGLRFSDADIPIDWDELELLAVINTKDLEWCDLLRCG